MKKNKQKQGNKTNKQNKKTCISGKFTYSLSLSLSVWKNKYTISPNEYPIRFDSIVIHPSPSFINLSRLPFTKQRVASECRESHINSGELIDLWHAIRAGCGASEVKVTSDTLRRGKREGKKEVALLLLWHSGETSPGSAGTHSRCYLDVAP